MENPILKIIFPVVFFSIVFGPLVVGVFMRLPRWSMVFGGLLVSVVGIYSVFSFFNRTFESQISSWYRNLALWTPNSRLLWQWIHEGMFWVAILVTFLILAGLIALIPWFRSFTRRLWKDWTLISYIFYGASLLIFFIDFDEYRYDEWYRLASMLALAMGAWGYLRASSPVRRTAALLVGITVCMAIMGVGKYFLVPLQDWAQWFRWHSAETERWFESLRTIASWFWMIVFIGLPGLLQTLRREVSSAQLASEVEM